MTLSLLAGAALGACGGESRSPAVAAKPAKDRFSYARGLFGEMCAGCHTLADANATGSRSNLDTSILERIERPAREHVVRVAMDEDPTQQGAGYMPRWKGVLTDRDYEALVEYIVEVTGVDGS